MFEDDADKSVFFDDFAEDIILFPGEAGEKTISAIFEDGYAEAEEVDGTQPQFIARTDDLTDLENNDTIQRNAQDYTVRSIQPDGTGMSNVIVTEA